MSFCQNSSERFWELIDPSRCSFLEAVMYDHRRKVHHHNTLAADCKTSSICLAMAARCLCRPVEAPQSPGPVAIVTDDVTDDVTPTWRLSDMMTSRGCKLRDRRVCSSWLVRHDYVTMTSWLHGEIASTMNKLTGEKEGKDFPRKALTFLATCRALCYDLSHMKEYFIVRLF